MTDDLMQQETADDADFSTLNGALGEIVALRGAVAKAVGNRVQRLRRDDGTASGGEVNRALGRRLTEALPTIDLAHGDLA
jgi:hypothetical protein